MINFFRKTRKKLADDNKPLKYARYAIGEIVLVVIGILIALSINNWNEIQREKKIQTETLDQLQSEMENQLNEIQHDLRREKQCVHSSFLILDLIENFSSVPDTMGGHFYLMTTDVTTYLRTAAFESLKSKNLELVTNDSLRVLIQLFYDDIVKRISSQNSIFPSIRYYTDDYFRKNFTSTHARQETIEDLAADLKEKWKLKQRGSWHFQSYFPNDFNRLKNDQEFRFIVNNTIKFRSARIVYLEEAIFTCENILRLIKSDQKR